MVNARGDVADGDPTPTVVLDAAWSRAPDDPPSILPVREVLLDILDSDNLFLRSLELLDAWADAAGLVDRFSRDGVTWWFHARSFLRLDLQELLLWCRVLDRLLPPDGTTEVIIPGDRPLLAAAVRARGDGRVASLQTASSSRFATSDITGRPAADLVRQERPRHRRDRVDRSPLATLLAAIRRRRRPGGRRARMLRRVRSLRASPGPVLAVVRVGSFHHVEAGGRLVRRDPYVGPVVERLAAEGMPTATVALGMGMRRAVERRQLKADRRLIPASALDAFGGDAADRQRDEATIAKLLAQMPAAPMLDGDRDLGPVMAATVRELGPWLARQWADMDRAGRLMDELRPRALLTGWEAARTAWLGAARQRRIPSVAIQHGVIYPSTPDYCRPHSPSLVRPDVTCVYGPYDRSILTGQGGYAEDRVAVTGSPRLDPDALVRALTPAQRSAVRSELGLAPDERMLVVSGGRMTVGDRLMTVPLLARVLDGPLPGVHVVVKLHPEEPDGEHYRTLLEGLARAGGYAPAPLTLVRDLDVYRLLQAADGHLGVLSTVLTDGVLAGTPTMIVVGQALSDLVGYVASGVAHPVRTAADVGAFMADPRPIDPDARRRFVESHFAAGDAVARIAGIVGSTVTATP